MKAKCFVQEKCKNPSGAESKMIKIMEDGLECKNGMQVNFFTEEKALLQMQVEGKMKESEPDLSIYRGDKLVIGCKKNAKGGYEVIGHENLKKDHKFELFEHRTMFGPERSICAIKIEKMKKIIGDKSLKNILYFLPREKLNIRYFGQDNQPISIEYDLYDLDPFTINEKQCDPGILQSGQQSPSFHVLPIVDLDRKTLDCTNYGKLTYTLRRSKEGNDDEVMRLECTDTHDYKMIISDSPLVEEPLSNPRDYQFFCATPINRICETPFDTCPTCPKYTKGTDAAEANLECPEGKWLIDEKYHTLRANDKVICKESESSEKAAFFLIFASEELGEIELIDSMKVSCFIKYDCSIASDLDYSDCKQGDDCGVLEHSNGVMKCENPVKYKLSVFQVRSNVSLTAQEYTCDGATGKWKGNGTVLEEGAQVRCVSEDVEAKKPEVGFTQAHVNMAIAATVVITIVVAGLFIFLAVCVRRKLKTARIEKKKWEKMKLSDRIKYAKQAFEKVTNASPDSVLHIKNGFETLEVLLDTDTEDPEIWELVYPFLLRVLGSLDSIDYNLSDLYLRYLYLQAKKIIDDNGWKSRTPITKSNPKGLIRCVAINFLACCVFARDDEDVTMLVEDGYRKLGFNAVEQYPHCGQLWALISLLNNNYSNPSDPLKDDCCLDMSKFMDTLYKMSKKPLRGLKSEDIIPQFGSISDQAATALGRSADPEWHYKLPKLYFQKNANEKNRETVTKYLAGLGHTINFDAGSRIFHQMYPIAHYNEKAKEKKDFVPLHEILLKIAPVDVWNSITDEIMMIMVYFNRSHDAKKLQNLLLPDVKQPTEYYTELRATQQQFRSAIEDQLDELWSWFTPKMDVAELRVRPALIAACNAEVSDETVPMPEGELPNVGRLLDPTSPDALAAPEYAAAAPSKDAAAAAAEDATQPIEEPAKP